MAARAHDHRHMNAEQPSDNQGEEVDSMIGVLRGFSLEATGGYTGASASISIGRLVSSIVKGREQSGVSRGSNIDGQPGPKSLFRADDSNFRNASREGPMLVSAGVADRLLVGYSEAHFNKISYPSHTTITPMACSTGLAAKYLREKHFAFGICYWRSLFGDDWRSRPILSRNEL